MTEILPSNPLHTIDARVRFMLACVALGLLVVGCRSEPPAAAPESDVTKQAQEPSAEHGRGSAERPASAQREAIGSASEVVADKPAQAAKPRVVRMPTSPDPMPDGLSVDAALEGIAGKGDVIAELHTTMGVLRCALFPDKAPRAVANFVGFARGKRPFWDAKEAAWVTRPHYDGTHFHRVIPEFMIQGGDALGDGTGTTGYTFPDEVHPSLKHDRAGQLCMANRGPHTNAAQFFITEGAAPHLDGSYTIFGQCEPTELVSRIARVPQSGPPHNRPLEPVVIERVEISRKR